MRIMITISQLLRLTWLIVSLVVLFQFASELAVEAGTITLPCAIASVVYSVQCCLLAVFAVDRVALAFAGLGQLQLAESIMNKSIKASSLIFGEGGFGLAAKRARLAEIYLLQNREAEAEAIYSRIVSQWKPTFLSKFSETCASLESYVKRLKKANRSEDALKIQSLIRGWKLASALSRALMAVLVILSATYLVEVKQGDAAIANLREHSDDVELRHELLDSLASIEGLICGPSAPARLYHGESWLCYFPAETRNIEQTEWAVARAIPFARKSSITETNLADCLMWRGEIEESKADLNRAEALFKEALALLKKHDKSSSFEATMDLAHLYQRKKQYERAQAYYSAAAQLGTDYFGKENSRQADALLGLAGAQMHAKKWQDALAVLQTLCPLAEKLFYAELKFGTPTRECYRRVLNAFLFEQNTYMALGKEEQADEVNNHLNEIEQAKLRNFKLDASTRDLIAENAQELSRCLLAIKLKTKDRDEARKKLTKILEASSKSVLFEVEHDSPDFGNELSGGSYPMVSSSGPGKGLSDLSISFIDLIVESPDSAGWLTVKARGTAALAGERIRPFGFYFKLKPVARDPGKILVHQIALLETTTQTFP